MNLNNVLFFVVVVLVAACDKLTINNVVSEKVDYITPQQFGALENDTIDDHAAFNAMYRHLESINIPDPHNLEGDGQHTPIKVLIPPGIYFINDTVVGPKDFAVNSDKKYPNLQISGFGATLYSNKPNVVQLFFGGKNGTDFSELDKSDYSVFIEGLTFAAGGGPEVQATITGLFFGATDYSVVEDCKINHVGTGIHNAAGFGNVFRNIEMQQPRVRGFLAETAWKNWDDISNPCNSGNTELTVENVRVVGGYHALTGPMLSHFEFNQCSGVTFRNCISEGVRPLNNVIINYKGNACTNPFLVDRLYIENASVPGSPTANTNIWLKSLAYKTLIKRTNFNLGKPDTLIKIDKEGGGYLSVEDFDAPFNTNFQSAGFVAMSDNWRHVDLHINRPRTPEQVRDLAAALFDPYNTVSRVAVYGPNLIASSSSIDIANIYQPSSNLKNTRTINVRGNLTFEENTQSMLGIRSGANGFGYRFRPHAIGVGDGGLIGNYSSVFGWDMTEVWNATKYPTPKSYIGYDTTGVDNIIFKVGSSTFKMFEDGSMSINDQAVSICTNQ